MLKNMTSPLLVIVPLILFALFFCSIRLVHQDVTESQARSAVIPSTWRPYKFEYGDVELSIHVPSSWYLIQPDQSYRTKAVKSYIFTNVEELQSYHDWSTNEYLMLDISFYDVDFVNQKESIVDNLEKSFVAGRNAIEYVQKEYQINECEASRYIVSDEYSEQTSLREVLLVRLSEKNTLVITASIVENTPYQAKKIIQKTIGAVLDTVFTGSNSVCK